MRLKLQFGLKTTPIQCDWNKPILDFPKIVNYAYRNWEWIVYNPIPGAIIGSVLGYEMMFSELKHYDPRAMEMHPTLASIIDGVGSQDCDCGGDKHSGSGGHWKFCKLYGKP